MRARPAAGISPGFKPRPTESRTSVTSAPPTFRPRLDDMLEPVYRLVARVIRIVRWVMVRLALRYPVQWFAWQVAADERTCPECGALQGRIWPEDRPGPTPPLHVNCRCQVVPHHTEWRTRYVPTWQQRTVAGQAWAWTRTGWA